MSLITSLGDIPDPRRGNARRHDLLDILTIALVASIRGAESWTPAITPWLGARFIAELALGRAWMPNDLPGSPGSGVDFPPLGRRHPVTARRSWKIASVSQNGMTSPAPLPSAGQIAPKM